MEQRPPLGPPPPGGPPPTWVIVTFCIFAIGASVLALIWVGDAQGPR